MRKLIITGVVIVLIAALIVLALVNLNTIVNRNKDFILSKAEASIGREITVEEIGVSLRGGIGMRLTGVTLADDPAFSSENFIEADYLHVNAKIWPLLRKQFEVKRLILHKPVIRLIKNENGEFNMNSLTEEKKSEGKPGPKTESEADPALAIAFINIEDGELHYTDTITNQTITVTDIDSKTEDLDLNHPITIQFEAAFLSEKQNISLTGTFGPLKQNASTEDIPIKANVTCTSIHVEKLKETLPQINTTLPKDLELSGPVKIDLQINGTLASLELNGNLNGSSLSIAMPELFTKPENTALSVEVGALLTQDRIQLNKTSLTVHTISLQVDGQVIRTPAPALEINVKSNDIPLADLSTLLPTVVEFNLAGSAGLEARIEGSFGSNLVPEIEGTITIANGRAEAPQLPKPITDVNGRMTFTKQSAAIHGVIMKIGDTDLQMNINVASFKPLEANYEIISSEIDLSDFRPQAASKNKPGVLQNVRTKGSMTINASTKDAAGHGTLTSNLGSVSGVDYNNFSAAYSMTGKDITIKKASLNALDGSMSATGHMRLGESSSTFDMQSQLRGVDFAGLIRMLPSGTKSILEGKTNLDINISGNGKEWNDIKYTLSGDGLAEVVQGMILDFNIVDQILNNIVQYPVISNMLGPRMREKHPKLFSSPHTEFRQWKSDFILDNGKLRARNLVLNSKDFNVIGKGTLDFERSLELEATLVMSEGLTKSLTEEANALRFLSNDEGKIELPLRLSGILPKVNIRLDEEILKQALQRSFFSKGLNELKNKGLQDLYPSRKKPDTTGTEKE